MTGAGGRAFCEFFAVAIGRGGRKWRMCSVLGKGNGGEGLSPSGGLKASSFTTTGKSGADKGMATLFSLGGCRCIGLWGSFGGGPYFSPLMGNGAGGGPYAKFLTFSGRSGVFCGRSCCTFECTTGSGSGGDGLKFLGSSEAK